MIRLLRAARLRLSALAWLGLAVLGERWRAAVILAVVALVVMGIAWSWWVTR